MIIKSLCDEIEAITSSELNQAEKEKKVIQAVQKYSKENKISFEATLDLLNDFAIKSREINNE